MNLALIREAVTELQRRKLRTGLTLTALAAGLAAYSPLGVVAQAGWSDAFAAMMVSSDSVTSAM